VGDNDSVGIHHAVAAGAGITFSCVAVIIAWRYSISFLKTSMNSTARLPTLSAVQVEHARIASEYRSA
jgi:hypothetical protein